MDEWTPECLRRWGMFYFPDLPGPTPEHLTWSFSAAFPVGAAHAIRWVRGKYCPVDWTDKQWVTFFAEDRIIQPDYYDNMISWVRSGDVDPITVVEYGPAMYGVWDGYHRLAAARIAGVDFLPAVIGKQCADSAQQERTN